MTGKMTSSSNERSCVCSIGRFLPLLFVCGCTAISLLVVELWQETAAHALEAHGLVTHSLNGGDNTPVNSALGQRYTFTQGFSSEPTDAITASLSLTYNWSQEAGGPARDLFIPSAGLALANEFINAEISGTTQTQKQTSGGERTLNAWEARISNRYRPKWWPSIQMHYGVTDTTQSSDVRTINDTQSNTYGLSLSQPLYSFGQFFYTFESEILKQEIDRSQRETSSHYAVYSIGRKGLLNNRLNVDFNQSIRKETQEFISLEEGGLFEFQLARFFSVYAAPEVLLGVDPDLTLRTLNDLAPIELPDADNNDTYHIGLADFFQTINQREEKITLNVLVEDPDGLWEGHENSLQWALKVSQSSVLDEVGTVWDDVQLPYTVSSYDPVKKRFTIDITALQDIDPTYQSLKLVITNSEPLPPLGLKLVVRGIETSRYSSQSSERTSYGTQAKMRLRISRSLTATSNLTMDSSEYSKSRRLNGSLGWSVMRGVYSSINYNENRTESDLRETLNQGYGLNLSLQPIPTMAIGLSARRTKQFANSFQTNETDSYQANTSGTIYPDLTYSLSGVYRTTNYFTRAGSIYRTDKILTGILTINARLYRSLSATFKHNYYQNIEPLSYLTNSSIFTASWRPSNYFSFGTTYYKIWTGEGADRLDLGLGLGLLRERKVRVNFTSSYTSTGGEGSLRNGLAYDWDISTHLAFKGSANYSISRAGTNSWIISSNLYMTL